MRGPKPAVGAGSTPTPSAERPVAPGYLSQLAKSYFDTLVARLEEIGAASDTYNEAITLCAVRLSEIERLTAVLDAQGSSFETETPSGALMVRARPEYAQRSEAMRHAGQLLGEMGLTVTGIARVRTKPKSKKSSANEFGDVE